MCGSSAPDAPRTGGRPDIKEAFTVAAEEINTIYKKYEQG